MACLGLSSGFVVVPLNALIQWRSPADRRGAVIAFSNTLVFGGVLLGSLGCGLLATIGLSALFSPSKYGILPELLPHHRLSWGNGQLEMWTFVAIIGGTALAGPLLDLSGPMPWMAGLILVIFSGMGLWASFLIPPVPQARPDGGIRETWQGAVDALRADRVLTLGVLGSIAFWTLASLVGQDVLVYAKAVLPNHFWASI